MDVPFLKVYGSIKIISTDKQSSDNDIHNGTGFPNIYSYGSRFLCLKIEYERKVIYSTINNYHLYRWSSCNNYYNICYYQIGK